MARLFCRRDLTIALILVLFAVQVVIRYQSHLDPEIAWQLYAGGRLIDGAALYDDVVEINPPLGLWLSAAVAALASEVGMSSALFLKTALLILTGASVAISARFLAAATDVSATTRHMLTVLIAALMLFLPGTAFGQPEQFAIVLITPWVLLRWNRLIDRSVPWLLAAAVGLGAALAMWIKPHYAFLLVSIEVTMLFATRNIRTSLRIETLTVVAFGIAYLVIVRTLWSSTLLTTVALYGSRAYIPFFGVPVEDVAVQLILPFVLAAIAVVSAPLLSARLLLLRTLLFVAGATFTCAYVLQSGERYQVLPALHFLAFAAGLGVTRVLAGDVSIKTSPWSLASAGGAAMAILAVFVGASAHQSVPYRGTPFEDVIAAEAPDAKAIFIASTDIADSFPLVSESGLVWASRFPSLWFSPHIATKLDDDGRAIDDIARFVLGATIDDLIDFRPDVVFVDQASERSWYREEPLDYLVFWDTDPRFESFWKGYERRGATGDFGVYVRAAVPVPDSSGNVRDADRADPFGCILADVINSFC